MKELRRTVLNYLRGIDLLLLFLGLAAAGFGIVIISSAGRAVKGGAASLVNTQIIGVIIGVLLFFLLSAIDLEFLSRLWKGILGFSVLFILLIIPFGKEVGGNRSWIIIPGVPMGIQPAEIVKVCFIVLLAAHIYATRDKTNSLLSIGGYTAHMGFMVGLIVVLSKDLGVALIYVFIFLSMLLCAGLKARWFGLAGVGLVAVAPLAWSFLTDKQRERILIILNPMADPEGVGYQSLLSIRMIGSGKLFGQGLYHGTQTQRGGMYSQQADFIYAVCGEELGFIGCMAVVLLLGLIIIRCIYTAAKSKSALGSLACAGVAGMLIFQTYINIGMCLGVAPVIGITLPFFSAGGSSIIASFAALGLVSSVRLHKPDSGAVYIGATTKGR